MTSPDPKKSRSRYIPAKSTFPDLTINARDIEILRLVYQHRFLDTNLIWHLFETGKNRNDYSTIGKDGKKRPAKYGFGQKALYKRLQVLFHKKYLTRHFVTDQPMGRGHGSPRAIYGLGPGSPKVLEEELDIPSPVTRRIIESNKVKSPFLRHALEVATFRSILELACQKSQGRINLLFWEQGEAIRDFVLGINEKGEDERFPVHADAFFGLGVIGMGNTHFFLEIDRGTEPIVSSKQRTDIRRKLIGYRLYRKSQRFLRRYAYRQLPNGQIIGLDVCADVDAQNQNVITGFQVLFVTPGAISQDRSLSGRLAGIFAELPSLGKFFVTSSLFWFTPPESFSIEEPQRIFFKCWITPNPQNHLLSMVE